MEALFLFHYLKVKPNRVIKYYNKMIKIKYFVFNDFQENTFVLFDESNRCIIIDPGCFMNQEKTELEDFLQSNNLVPEKIVNTHSHVDHILGNSYLVDKYNLPVYAHEADEMLISTAREYAKLFGLTISQPPVINQFLKDNDELTFGNSSLKVMHVPGHSPGSLAFYSVEQKFVISGDVLFYGSIGRTDLPGGNYDLLINSIKQKLLKLPGDTEVYPGHGPVTTIQQEHDTNPFLQ